MGLLWGFNRMSMGFPLDFYENLKVNWNQLKVNWNQLKSNWNQLIQYYSTPVPKKNHIKVKPEVVWRGAYTDQDPTLNNNYFDAFSPGYSSPFGLMLWPLKRGYLANKYSTEFVLNDGRWWHRKKNNKEYQITGQHLIYSHIIYTRQLRFGCHGASQSHCISHCLVNKHCISISIIDNHVV